MPKKGHSEEQILRTLQPAESGTRDRLGLLLVNTCLIILLTSTLFLTFRNNEQAAYVNGALRPASARRGSATLAVLYVNKSKPCPGSGTSSSPYCSIQNALNAATPGTDIRIQNSGTSYNETDTLATSGTVSNPIIIESDDPANPPTLTNTGSTGTQSYQLELNGTSNVIVQHLKWDGTGADVAQTAVQLECSAGTNPSGIQILNNTFTNWAASNSTINYPGTGNSAIWSEANGNSTGCHGTVIRGNTFTGVRHTAIELWNSVGDQVLNNTITGTVCGMVDGNSPLNEAIHEDCGTHSGTPFASNELIQGNTITGTVGACPFSIGSGGYQEFSGIHVDDGCSGGKINANTINNMNAPSTNTAYVGIHIELNVEGYIVSNNLISNMATGAGLARGIFQDPTFTGATTYIVNNTVYNNNYIGIEYESDAKVENNISFDNGAAQIAWLNTTAPGTTTDYNLFWDTVSGAHTGVINQAGGGSILNFTGWKSSIGGDAHSISADPSMVSPSTGNFKLNAGSPAINAGATMATVPMDFLNMPRPQGINYCPGAYEYPE
jgi:hypothetical protein